MLRYRGTYVQSFRSGGIIVTEELKSKAIVARIIRIRIRIKIIRIVPKV